MRIFEPKQNKFLVILHSLHIQREKKTEKNRKLKRHSKNGSLVFSVSSRRAHLSFKLGSCLFLDVLPSSFNFLSLQIQHPLRFILSISLSLTLFCHLRNFIHSGPSIFTFSCLFLSFFASNYRSSRRRVIYDDPHLISDK